LADRATHNWSGVSGREYVYRVYRLPAKFKNLPGNYIFTKPTEVGGWLPVYIGETNDLGAALGVDHPELPCVREQRATHVHAHQSSDEQTNREAEVEDLVEIWAPPCNDQIHTTRVRIDALDAVDD